MANTKTNCSLVRIILSALLVLLLAGLVVVSVSRIVRSTMYVPTPGAVSTYHMLDIAIALHAYAQEHDGRLPNELHELVPEYIADDAGLLCPTTEDNPDYPGVRAMMYRLVHPSAELSSLASEAVLLEEPDFGQKVMRKLRSDGKMLYVTNSTTENASKGRNGS